MSSQLKTIAENAGKSADVVLEKVLANDNFNFGYNARTDVYGDLVEQGILDATKVVRCAIGGTCISRTSEITDSVKDLNDASIVKQICSMVEYSMSGKQEYLIQAADLTADNADISTKEFEVYCRNGVNIKG